MGDVFLNGRFVPKEEATVSVFDHGFLYGDGIFEGIRAYNGRVFRLEEHLIRLEDSAKALLLKIPYSRRELTEIVVESCRRNGLRDAYIRVVVSRGAGDLGLDPTKCPQPTVVVIADTISIFPERLYEEGLSVMTVATRRNRVDALDPRVKSLNYLNNILAKIEANLVGKPEVVLLNSEGYVTEGTGDNIFVVRDGVLRTPPVHLGILAGITRATVMELARQQGIPVAEEVFTRYDLYTADECFLTGTAAEIIPVVEVDGRRLGSGVGPIARGLIGAYRQLARESGTPILTEPARN